MSVDFLNHHFIFFESFDLDFCRIVSQFFGHLLGISKKKQITTFTLN